MWYLVFINIMLSSNEGYNEPVIEGWFMYETLTACFEARETVAEVLQKGDGKQAICILKN